MPFDLKPALVLGSGFHRHVFGDGHHTVARPLYDWHYLVTQTSQRLQVAITRKTKGHPLCFCRATELQDAPTKGGSSEASSPIVCIPNNTIDHEDDLYDRGIRCVV